MSKQNKALSEIARAMNLYSDRIIDALTEHDEVKAFGILLIFEKELQKRIQEIVNIE